MDFPVIISFYTANTPYEEEVKSLISSCERFALRAEIEPVPSFGKWELNCAYKPFFILGKLEKLNEPLLWVDADGVFLRKPTWQKAFEGDFAVRFHADLPNTHPSKVISSTLFVRPTQRGKGIMREWIRQSHAQLLDLNRVGEFWDQVALRDALIALEEKVTPIPLSYAKIFDNPLDCLQVPEPVIEHYQASRRLKS